LDYDVKSYFYLPAHETDEKRTCVYRESIGAAPLPLFTEEPARIEVATHCEYLKVLHDIEKEAMPGLIKVLHKRRAATPQTWRV
jgi:hypothetical protein